MGVRQDKERLSDRNIFRVAGSDVNTEAPVCLGSFSDTAATVAPALQRHGFQFYKMAHSTAHENIRSQGEKKKKNSM